MEIYCLKCKKPTDSIHEEYVEVDSTKGLRRMIKAICVICKRKKSKFVKLRSTGAEVLAHGKKLGTGVLAHGKKLGTGVLSHGKKFGGGVLSHGGDMSKEQILSELRKTISSLKEKVKSTPLTDLEINHYVKELDIKNFRGVFARDKLISPEQNECLICNTG